MELKQNDLEYLLDQVHLRKMTADQANVARVRMQRVELVTYRLTAQVRRALNAAVKTGQLGHMVKKGHKPEVYFHPEFKYLANEERTRHEYETLRSIKEVAI